MSPNETASQGSAPAAAPAVDPAASSAAVAGVGATSKEPTAAEILAFDPFGPSEETTEATITPTGTPPADGTQPAGTPATPVATPAPAPATPAATPAGQPMEQTVAEMAATIRSLTERPAPAPAAPAPTEEKPFFNLGVPPKLIAAMNSEDENERGMAVHAVVNGVANVVWNAVQKHIAEEVIPGMSRIAEAHLASKAKVQEVFDDFYGTHQNLKVPALRPLIQSVAVSVAQARAAAGKSVAWSPEMRDDIAEQVYALVPALRPAAAAAPTPTPTPAGRPVFTTGGTGGGAPPAPVPANEFADILNLF